MSRSSLSWYLQRLSRMDTTEIASRVWRTGRDRIRHMAWSAEDKGAWTSSRRLTATLGADPADLAKRWDRGGFMLHDELPPAGHPDYAAWPGLDVDRVMETANLALDGKISVFGLPPVGMTSHDDWHSDPLGHGRWPEDFAPLMNHRDTRSGGARILWEMHRLTHLTALGHAYRLTGDPRFAFGVRDGLLSWMEANPPHTGLGWQSPLELAIRAISILHSADLVAGSGALSGRVAQWLGPCLAHHARDIELAISVGSSANNHTIGEAAGLVVIGSRLPELRRADRWRRLGMRVLNRALDQQFAPDGSGREQAPHYQAFAMDFVVQATVALRRSDTGVPDGWLHALDRGARFLASLVVHGGRAIEPGDSDDGRVHGLGPHPHFAVRDTVRTVAALLRRPDILTPAVGTVVSPTARWLVEDLGSGHPGAGPAANSPSVFHPDAGWAVMRSGVGPTERTLFFDAGPHGLAPLDAHAHADALAISLHVAGEPVIVDPGTYRYHGDPRWRDHFRSTRAHATVEIDGKDQSTMAGPFLWSHRATPRVHSIRLGRGLELLDASHDGYASLDDPVRHRRRIMNLGDGRFLVHDRIETEGVHRVTTRLPLAPGTRVEPPEAWQSGDEGVSILAETPRGALLGTVIGASIPLELEVREGEDTAWYSSEFCRKTAAPVVEATGTCHGSCDIWTYLSTAAPGEQIGTIPEAAIRLDVQDDRGFSVDGALGLGLLDRTGFSVLMLAPPHSCGPLHAASWSFRGLAAMRTEAPGTQSPSHRLLSASPIELKKSGDRPMETREVFHSAG